MPAGQWLPAFEQVVRHHLPLSTGPLRSEVRLADLGLDSVRTVSLLLELEDCLGISVPDEALVPEMFETADSLWTVVAGLITTQPTA